MLTGAARERARPRRRFRAWLAVSLGAGTLLLEPLLRLLLFGDGLAARIGAPLRHPELYADVETDELWWQLNALFRADEEKEPTRPSFDPVLGWCGSQIDAATYRHRDESRIGNRRSVLLYGESLAGCFGLETCWDVLLERSVHAGEFALLNYGVSGHGLDQTWLLFERSIDHYADENPIVLIGVFVEDSLDRVGHRLRTLPKPWFEADGEELVFHAPLASSARDFVAAHPPSTPSFVWRRILRAGILPEAWAASLSGSGAKVSRTSAVCRLLLQRFEHELERRGLEHAFVLFHARASLGVDSYGWEEPLLLDELARLGAPYVSTRVEFRADMERTARLPSDYFRVNGQTQFHYSTAAQEVAFGTLLRALEQRYDPPRPGDRAER